MKIILDKIIAECPKAWAEMCRVEDLAYGVRIELEGNDIKFLISHNEADYFNFRNWYDYFDEKDIRIALIPDEEYAVNDCFEYSILQKIDIGKEWLWRVTVKGLDTYSKRVTCEWLAFYEAFKIREQQLK